MKTIPHAIILCILGSFVVLSVGFIHVERGFAAEMISPLAAVRQGLHTIDDMIAQKKLDPSWAANLTQVSVSIRNIKDFTEYVVSVTRSTGTPAEMSIYLNMNGGFSGSSIQSTTGSGPGE